MITVLRSFNAINRLKIVARDGEVGEVEDLYFDDENWCVRYIVVETGNWLQGRQQILLSPQICGITNWKKRRLPVRLTRAQVKNSPPLATDRPVSRQYEHQLSKHFDWPYWRLAGPTIAANMKDPDQLKTSGDPDLRSAKEVRGYRINALDGEIGYVADFIIDLDDWQVLFLVVNTRNWLPGREVLLTPASVKDVVWMAQEVVLDLTRETIKNSPVYDPAAPINVDQAQAVRDYYGRPHPRQ